LFSVFVVVVVVIVVVVVMIIVVVRRGHILFPGAIPLAAGRGRRICVGEIPKTIGFNAKIV
jgi:hypothetical protein